MSDMICRKTMMSCQTPGMCSPHGGCKQPETLYATIDRDELKRLQKDAERYRFLRACESWEDALPLMADSIVSRYVETINLTGDDLDRAIDAALLSAQGDSHE